MKPDVLAVIPARMESSRFPGKPLAKIGGKSILELLYRELTRAKKIDRVVVASDSNEIIEAVEQFGGETIRTSKKHKTGSDRVSEVASKLGGNIIINIQADNLGIKAREFDRVISAMANDRKIKYATFIQKIEFEDYLDDPNRVKVIGGADNYARWFSRNPLPYLQGKNDKRLQNFDYFYHIGIYFFRKKALENFKRWKRTPFEKAESLEQLRILENEQKIKLFKTTSRIYSVDTPEDLARLKNITIK